MRTGKLEITKDPWQTKRLKFKNSIKWLKDIVTVEPLTACYQMAICLSKPALDNLEFEKSCRVNLKYNSTVCDAILSGHHSQHSSENKQVQTVISNMHSWQQPVQSFTPLILILFLGSFSDRHKWRKPFFLVPIIGELFGTTGCIFCIIFMEQLPLEAQGVFQKIIPSLFGGQTMLVMATTAYIADVSSIKMRTLRLGVLQMVISVVLPTVQAFSGIFFVKTGYMSVLSASVFLHFLALLYGIFWIKENRHQVDGTRGLEKKCILLDTFDREHAKETFSLLTEKRADNDRLVIWVFLLMVFLQRSAFDGESNVLYLYTQNVFQWRPLEFSYFLTVNSLVALAGHLFLVPLFTRVLHFTDSTIILISMLDKIVTNLFFGLAPNYQVFYAGVAISVFTKPYRTAKKSIATKIVSEKDIAKAQSLLGICDVLGPAISIPIYNKVLYQTTFSSFPAAFFFFSIAIYGICSTLILAMYIRISKKSENNKAPESCSDENVIHL